MTMFLKYALLVRGSHLDDAGTGALFCPETIAYCRKEHQAHTSAHTGGDNLNVIRHVGPLRDGLHGHLPFP